MKKWRACAWCLLWGAVQMAGAGAQNTAPAIAQAAAAGAGQDWPARAVRLLVGFPPGSSTDTSARILAPKLAELWGKPVVMENRSGAGGSIATTMAAQATPDGHTAIYVSASFAIHAILRANPGYDPLRDFIAVSQVGFPTSVIAVAPSLGVKSIKELIALAHERGGKLLYGTPGAGTSGHLTVESFRLAAGMKATHIAFKGQPEVLVEILAGRVHYAVISLGPGLGLIRDGRLLPLAMVTPKRSPVLPEVPALVEILPNFRRDAAHMILVPAKTPRRVVDKMSRDIARALESPDVKKQMEVIDFIVAPTSPEETDKILRAQLVTFEEVTRAAGLK
jgi:tripartite-type tricarboxylate transporter receptor subunit TctC